MIVVESLINNVTYVVELSDVSTLSISQAIAAKDTSLQVLQQVNNQKSAIDVIQGLVQTLRDQSEGFSVSAGQSASSALSNKNATDVNLAQTLSALNSAVQIALGQATGIAGILPTARIRANMQHLPPEFTFVRSGSGATFFDRNFNLVRSNANQPRFDYDPVTGQALGLLIESTVTTATDSINHGMNIPPTNASVVDNGLVNSPNGISRVYTINPTAPNGFVSFQTLTGPYTTTVPVGWHAGIGIYLLRETSERYCYLRLTHSGQNTTGGVIIVNLVTGQATPISISGSPTTGLVFSVIRDGAYWYVRLFTGNVNGIESSQFAMQLVPCAQNGSTTVVHPPITYSSIFAYTSPDRVFRSHVLGSAGTSKPADTLNMLPQNWNQSEGTIFVRARANSLITQPIFSIDEVSGVTFFRLRADGLLSYAIDSVEQTISTGSSGLGQYDIWAISYTSTRISVSRNGGVAQSITIPRSLVPTLIRFQSIETNTGASKHIHTIKYSRRALTDAQLQVRSNPNLFFGIENGDVALNADLADSAFTSVNAIQRLPSRTDIPFPGTGAAAQRIFSLDFTATLQLVHLPSGATYSVSAGTTVVPGTTIIPAGTTITVDFNVANNNILILAFLPAIQ